MFPQHIWVEIPSYPFIRSVFSASRHIPLQVKANPTSSHFMTPISGCTLIRTKIDYPQCQRRASKELVHPRDDLNGAHNIHLQNGVLQYISDYTLGIYEKREAI